MGEAHRFLFGVQRAGFGFGTVRFHAVFAVVGIFHVCRPRFLRFQGLKSVKPHKPSFGIKLFGNVKIKMSKRKTSKTVESGNSVDNQQHQIR